MNTNDPVSLNGKEHKQFELYRLLSGVNNVSADDEKCDVVEITT